MVIFFPHQCRDCIGNMSGDVTVASSLALKVIPFEAVKFDLVIALLKITNE